VDTFTFLLLFAQNVHQDVEVVYYMLHLARLELLPDLVDLTVEFEVAGIFDHLQKYGQLLVCSFAVGISLLAFCNA